MFLLKILWNCFAVELYSVIHPLTEICPLQENLTFLFHFDLKNTKVE